MAVFKCIDCDQLMDGDYVDCKEAENNESICLDCVEDRLEKTESPHNIFFYCGHCKEEYELPDYFAKCPICLNDDLKEIT